VLFRSCNGGSLEAYPAAGLDDRLEAYPAAGLDDRLEAYPTAGLDDRLEAYPAAGLNDRLEAYPTTGLDDRLEAYPTCESVTIHHATDRLRCLVLVRNPSICQIPQRSIRIIDRCQ